MQRPYRPRKRWKPTWSISLPTTSRICSKQLDGFTVQLPEGPVKLNTAGMVQRPLPISFIEQLLQLLIDPNIVFLLLAIGVQALLIEMTHPGAWVPAFFGVVCLSLAAYGLGFLPVNWFGLIFIVMAFVSSLWTLKRRRTAR